ncbi:MAG: hypothetical protein H6732_09575 [Alphaproteobacteria bacterium]|nr:hypothetical protein [Alphaproteobacteria bacterium]
MISLVRAAVAAAFFCVTTAVALAAAEAGWGAQDLDATVASLRAGSATGGRVYVGGGLRSGK